MRDILFDRRALCALGLFMLVLTGCASSPTPKFYQLSPVQNKALVTHDASPEQSLIIAIGPVRIPDYLDRSQIVTRSGKNELKLAEFDRWAGSLEENVNHVLMEDISSLLPAGRFFVVRWLPYLESELPVSYRVQVRVESFEGTPGDSVLLRAHWVISTKGKDLLMKKESGISEQVNGGSYDALVAAMSKALEALSREMADAIKSVSAAK